MRQRPVVLPVLLSVFAAPPPCAAQSPPQRPSATAPTTLPSRDQSFTIHSAVLGEDREILVHLPAHWDSGERFDVVYALDGANLVPVAGGIMDYRVAYQAPPKVVIVGITNNSAEGRWRDFTAVKEPPGGEDPPQGGAANFTKFLETEVMPVITARYPVTRHRTIIGHSLGGLFVLHLLADRPDLFERYIALSPVIPYMREEVLQALSSKLPTLHSPIWLYTSVGNEQEGFPEGLSHLEALLRQSAPATLRWKTERFPTLGHMESVGPGMADGLLFLFGPGH